MSANKKAAKKGAALTCKEALGRPSCQAEPARKGRRTRQWAQQQDREQMEMLEEMRQHEPEVSFGYSLGQGASIRDHSSG
jgi:hypothetical protein